ncbi:unnamed protein product [Rotaria sp. Silwood2]|nr:unnamed protein product [Rotaria sp. Silwood2]CAF3430678.1 unnamed protein product [Rotaria sp. Silwood2]CAF4158398.1 unnamed protein product [Rotaria sp. Silwood2]CAF4188739.1 unnamed protein product [Rotaria sp. Silwood2]CAF4522804.1 unnamed protein product [Rotaria sp. Silwood2]
MIVIIASHRACRTVTNLLTCNTSFMIANFLLNNLLGALYGFRTDWAENQPLCFLKAVWGTMSSAGICYSYVLQAMSRLFFAVFYKHKFLLTFRMHWYMIALNWIISILLAIEPIFINGALGFEEESRICVAKSKIFASSIYITVVVIFIPLNIAIFIYAKIFYRSYQATQQVVNMAFDTTASHMPNAKREKKLARNMVLIIGNFAFSGIIYAILAFWHIIAPNILPPKELYLMSMHTIVSFITLKMIFFFVMNKQVKDIVFSRLRLTRQRIHPTSNGQRSAPNLIRR